MPKDSNASTDDEGAVIDFLKFCFGRPLLKTDLICKKCKGYVSLKFGEGSAGKSGWVSRKCLCGTEIKYIKSGAEVKVTKDEYDPIYKKWKSGVAKRPNKN